MFSYQITPDKQLDNSNMPELFMELHNYKTIWERKRFLYDYALVSLNPNQIGWEIYITKDDASFYFTSSNNEDISLVKKSLPKSTIIENRLNLDELNTNPELYHINEMELKYHYFLSLSTDKKTFEPIASILDTQKILKDDEYAIVQYVFCPESYDWSSACTEAYERFKNGIMPTQLRADKKEIISGCARSAAKIALGAGEFVQELILDDYEKVERFNVTDTNVARILKDKPLSRATMEKAKYNAYLTTIRLLVRSKTAERQEQLMRGLIVSFNTVRLDNYLIPKKIKLSKDYISKVINREPSWRLVKNILTTEEVAKLCFLPQVTLQNTYKMKSIETREVDIPDILMKDFIPIGVARKNGVKYNISWENNYDIITLPKIVVGSMGSGKSKYTAVYVANAVNKGHGAIVFDYIMSCQLTKEIERHIPSKKTVVLDMSDISKVFSFAYSEVKITDDMTRWEKIKNASDLADQTAYLINALNDGAAQALTPKMIRILNAACMVTYSTGHIKVYDVINALQNHAIRHQYIEEAIKNGVYNINDIKIQDLLSLDELSLKGKPIGTNESKIEFIMDRINILLRNPYLELMLMADPDDSVNFVDYMNEGKAVLIRLPENVFKKKWIKDVIITYFMSRIWLATQIRSTQHNPKITHLVTDEIHQVPTAAKLVADTITESRKYGVAYCFTCQFLGQFKSLLEGVKGAGASYMLLAGTEKENFNLLKEESGEFTLEELMQLKEYTSFNIIKTSKGYKKFISQLPVPLEK